MPTIISKLDAEYFTVFSSGCIENLGKDIDDKNVFESWGDYLVEIVKRNKKKKIRFLIRNAIEGTFISQNFKYTLPSLPRNGVIILAIDTTSPKRALTEALKNNNINGISVVNHKDNKELINLLKNKAFLAMHNIKNVINCKDCIVDDNCDKMLCFNQKERFILIQKFKV